MSSSALGKAAEKRVRTALADNGYRLMTSQLSRGPADLLASKPGQTLAVQVKRSPRSGGGVGPAEWNALWEFAADFNAVPVIVFAPSVRGMRFMRVTGRKDVRGRQPWVPFVLDEIAHAHLIRNGECT